MEDSDIFQCSEGTCISSSGVTLTEDEYYLKYGDPRISDYPLMKSLKPTFILIALFLVFVKVIGPAWMKNRDPYNLRLLMITHNTILVILNTWVFLNVGMLGWFTTYRWRCEPIDFSNDSDALKIVEVCWVFFISKFMEFGDTVLFVLRKKDNQVTKLHVFHHCIAPIIFWIMTYYGSGGYNSILVLANSFVHIWMYLYYGLSAIGPSMQKYLWWKKYITSLQLLQFITVFWYMVYLHFFAPTYCKVSPFLIWHNISVTALFFVLFMNFYNTSYNKTQRIK